MHADIGNAWCYLNEYARKHYLILYIINDTKLILISFGRCRGRWTPQWNRFNINTRVWLL